MKTLTKIIAGVLVAVVLAAVLLAAKLLITNGYRR